MIASLCYLVSGVTTLSPNHRLMISIISAMIMYLIIYWAWSTLLTGLHLGFFLGLIGLDLSCLFVLFKYREPLSQWIHGSDISVKDNASKKPNPQPSLNPLTATTTPPNVTTEKSLGSGPVCPVEHVDPIGHVDPVDPIGHVDPIGPNEPIDPVGHVINDQEKVPPQTTDPSTKSNEIKETEAEPKEDGDTENQSEIDIDLLSEHESTQPSTEPSKTEIIETPLSSPQQPSQQESPQQPSQQDSPQQPPQQESPTTDQLEKPLNKPVIMVKRPVPKLTHDNINKYVNRGKFTDKPKPQQTASITINSDDLSLNSHPI